MTSIQNKMKIYTLASYFNTKLNLCWKTYRKKTSISRHHFLNILNYKNLILLSFLLLFLPIKQAVASNGSIGVMPMLIELKGKPGELLPFEITLYSTTKDKDGSAQLSFSDPIQELSGSIAFKKLGANPFSCSNWISLEFKEVTIPAGEKIIVKGKIKVPRNANGTRLATIMVDQKGTLKKGKMNMAVRYAVFLRLNIDGRKIQGIANIDNIQIVKNHTQTELMAVVENGCVNTLPISSRATIQDSNKRVVTRLELLSSSAIQRKEKILKNLPWC